MDKSERFPDHPGHPSKVPVLRFEEHGVFVGEIVSYGCHDCNTPKATGAWPDDWVALEEAGEHWEETGHRVYLLAKCPDNLTEREGLA